MFAYSSAHKNYIEVPPHVVEQMFNEYWIDGYPTITFNKEKTQKTIYDSLLSNVFGLAIPSEIGMLVMNMTDIHVFYGSNENNYFIVFMNIPIDDINKPFVWVQYGLKWVKYYLEQCNCVYNIEAGYSECQNIILSPGNGINSQYGSPAFSCCVQQVIGDRTWRVKNDRYSCRTCYKCVSKLRSVQRTDKFSGVLCGIEVYRLGTIDMSNYYTNINGDVNFNRFLSKLGLKLKYEHQEKVKTFSNLTVSLPGTWHLERLPANSKFRSKHWFDGEMYTDYIPKL